MISIKRHMMFAAAACIALSVVVTPAMAGGCNGVVNPFLWGCAPWDNNNGPKYPYYKYKKIVIPAKEAKVENKNGAQMVLHKGEWLPVIANGGGNVIAAGAGNVIANGAGN